MQFKQTPEKRIENQFSFSKSTSGITCFEFDSEEINGNPIKHNSDRYESAIEKKYYSYRQIIEDKFVQRTGFQKCQTGILSNSKVYISFHWNTNPDCARKKMAEEFNGCQVWNLFSGITFGIIPFWGSTTSEVSFKLFNSNSKSVKFIYNSSVYIVVSVLLLPVSWINLIRSVPEESLVQTVDDFLMDAGINPK
ncbi:hypothetical protein AB3N59_19665 [Leptospira sp. WS92.C1]